MVCCGTGLTNAVVPAKNASGERPQLIGPNQNRGCRDITFLLVFLVFLGGMGYIAYLALWLGDPHRLVYGVDSWGNVCGRRSNKRYDHVPLSGRDLSNEINLFYFDKDIFLDYKPGSFIQSSKTTVCVKSCPNTIISTSEALHNFSSTSGSRLCRYDVLLSQYAGGSSDALGQCPPLPIEEQSSVLHRCIPNSLNSPLELLTGAINSLLNKIDENFSKKCLSDLESTWREICYLSALAVGVSLVIVILLRFIAAVVIWLMVAVLAVGSVSAAVVCWLKYIDFKQDNVSDSTNEQNWLIGSIAATVVMILVLLILLIMRKRIGLVVQLFKEAGKAVASMPFLLIQPILSVLIIFFVLAGAGYIFLGMESAGHPIISNTTGFVSFDKDESVKYLKWYHVFGTIWIIQFILACERITIAGAIGEWYFQRNLNIFDFPVMKSTGRLIRYHLGSAAFGSFVIALVSFINMILTFIHNRIKNKSGECVAFLTKCLCCCFWCFEKFIKFLNSNAYIEIAILGCGFCKAARQAFLIIVGNALDLAAINSIGDFTLFLGKAGTVSVVAVVGIELMASRSDVIYTWLPISVSCMIAYIIASCFLGVYELCIDTIFICFCEDCDRNNGSDRPYAMSVGLMKFMKESNGEISTEKQNFKEKNYGKVTDV